MNRRRDFAAPLAVVSVIMALTAVPLHAQVGGGYDLTWNTIDAGGVTFATGAGFSLGSTSGQPDAGLQTGGGYVLEGGFWPATASVLGQPICGNGILDSGEECDSGIGCLDCSCDLGFAPTDPPSVDCVSLNVPAASTWGLASLTLLLLATGTIVIRSQVGQTVAFRRE